MKRTITAFIFAGAAANAAANPSSMVPPDDLVKPCERHIEAEQITKAVIPMTPFRGVNLIFPFELDDSKTTYSSSYDRIWDFTEAAGGSIVPVFFKSFGDEWGEITDLTISAHGYLFSLTLKADPNIRNHCTNIVFNLSEEELRRIEEREKKAYRATLDREYNKRFEALDEQAEKKALNMVGALSLGRSNRFGVRQSARETLSNGDRINAYVGRVDGWGRFTVVNYEIENDSRVQPLYIREVTVGQIQDNGNRVPLPGATEIEPRLSERQTIEAVWTTRENVPRTNGYMEIETDRGTVEVLW